MSDDMSKKEGILRMMASGRWAVYRPRRVPVEITSGELFRVEVTGAKELKLTRMEYDLIDRQYYSIDDYPLRDGSSSRVTDGDISRQDFIHSVSVCPDLQRSGSTRPQMPRASDHLGAGVRSRSAKE